MAGRNEQAPACCSDNPVRCGEDGARGDFTAGYLTSNQMGVVRRAWLPLCRSRPRRQETGFAEDIVIIISLREAATGGLPSRPRDRGIGSSSPDTGADPIRV